MSLLDDIKAKADANGDGKLTTADIEELKEQIPAEQFEALKAKADSNSDGKIDFEDAKNINWGDMLNDAKNTISGLFGK